MASGFSGQQFSFHGYLPIQSADRIKKLRQLEELAKRTGFTQLFMETPFRNESMLRDVFIALQPGTLFHVSCDLTLATEFTATKKIEDWKKEKHTFQKRYCIYAIGV
jgi:16S rRNA (cytidine1402-2'-O)-methyltransferase